MTLPNAPSPGIAKNCPILGIDPGLASTGVGVIEADGDGGWRYRHSAHVLTSRHTSMPRRLEAIHRLVSEVIGDHQPSVAAVESVFFARNVKSAVLMAHGRGAAILAISLSGIPVVEYSPLEIKQSVIGKGRGSKEQVKQMVSILLNLADPPSSDHETDALACALCHVYRARVPALLRGGEAEAGEMTAGEEKRKELLALSLGRRRRRRR